MKFKWALVVIILGLATKIYAQEYLIIVGSYTTEAKPKGIFVYDFNSQTGEMTYKNKAVVSYPTFVTFAPDQKHIYSVNENRAPFIRAFNYNPNTGELPLIN